MKYKLLFLISILLIANCGPSEEEIQDQIDAAVSEAIDESTDTSTTLTTATTQPTTTTTLYDSTCVDYANEIINVWQDMFDTTKNIIDIYTQMGDGALSYTDGANKLFEANLKWNKLRKELKSFNPNPENNNFHNKMLNFFDYISESNEIGVKALDEIDADQLTRATSLILIAYETLEEAQNLLPNGTIYGLRDAC